MNTIENDRLIVAGFMKVQVRTYTDGRTSYNPDKSWDLLRPVIIKISDLNGYTLPKQFKGLALDSPTNMVFDAAVEFIKWYNENKKD